MGRHDHHQIVSICIRFREKPDYGISQNTKPREDIIPSDDPGGVLAVWSIIVSIVGRRPCTSMVAVAVAVAVEQRFDFSHNDRTVFHQTKNKRIQ